MTPLRIGARTSPLARVQADWVAARLVEHGLDTEFVGVVTSGDVDQRALTQIGGTGVFVAAVRTALLEDRADLAVHSLKDLPTAPDPGLRVAAVPPREDVRDVLVGGRLADLPAGARIGTGSPRRAVQLQDWAREHGRRIEIVPVRGNVDTRIAHVAGGRLEACVLAAAGLRRLGRLTAERPDGSCQVVAGEGSLPAELVDVSVLLPAPGQAALAVEVAAAGAHPRLAEVDWLDDPDTHARVVAERSFLTRLEAGCLAPVGALATLSRPADGGAPQDLTLDAVIGRTVGSTATPKAEPLLRVQITGPVSGARQLGNQLAQQVLSRLEPGQRL
ncbi:hydroxymethylbilane synthase [Desertihabitans aurantiacus]|uniref:hydroxymethylbilane synthase n=1 Tax=Desertihabitans aurantiacus TaxID=2282477 RepID=UPI000DF7DA04|nr:hydroxymethylbilane synthase [Desertihabitans aurantiacus]